MKKNKAVRALLFFTYGACDSMNTFRHKLQMDAATRLNFEFRRVLAIKGETYFVCVYYGDNPQHTFTMVSKPVGGWRIVDAPKVPCWIMALEEKLSANIEQYQ